MSELQTAQRDNRIYYIDILRVIACLMVVMIHCCAKYTSSPIGSADFAVGVAFNTLSRPAVPIFVAVSGMLFLDEGKQLDLKIMLRKYILSLVTLYIAWSVIYALFDGVFMPTLSGRNVTLSYFLRLVITGTSYMWFLLMLIGLYLITPVLKSFVKIENKRLIEYFLAVIFIFNSAAPYIIKAADELMNSSEKISIYLLEQLEKFNMSFVGGYLFYFILGWYICRIGLSKKMSRFLIISSIVCVMLSIGSIVLLSAMRDKYTLLINTENLYLPTCVYTTGIVTFVATKFRTVKLNKNGIVCTLSKLTFGVYMVHIAIWRLLVHFGLFCENGVADMLIMFSVVTLSSFAVAFLMSKIPFAKRLIKA